MRLLGNRPGTVTVASLLWTNSSTVSSRSSSKKAGR
jgi:hypothetical protein